LTISGIRNLRNDLPKFRHHLELTIDQQERLRAVHRMEEGAGLRMDLADDRQETAKRLLYAINGQTRRLLDQLSRSANLAVDEPGLDKMLTLLDALRHLTGETTPPAAGIDYSKSQTATG